MSARQPMDAATAALYEQLRDLAARMQQRAGPGYTAEPTSMVHEAWERLAANEQLMFADRRHFMAIAARAMRNVLIDRARRRQAVKREGGLERVTLSGLGTRAQTLDLIALDQAFTALEDHAPRMAEVAVLRLMGGLTGPEVAEILGVSLATQNREWRAARALLVAMLRPDDP